MRYSWAWRGLAIDSTSPPTRAAYRCGSEVLQRHVEDVRSLVVAPAHVQPHPVRRHVAQRAVERRHRDVDEVEELAERAVGEQAVALHRQVGAVDLQHHGRCATMASYSVRNASATAFTYSASEP